MENKIYIASVNPNEKLISSLKDGGFEINLVEKEINDNDLYFLDLTNVTLDELNEKFPWIDSELKRSSTPHLRVLPLLIYDSSKEDPFKKWENGADEIYEELFSEEFKPFAYDLANPSFSNEELKHVLSLYYVR